MIFTHGHTDHVLGVILMLRKIAMLMLNKKYIGELTVYCHDELVKMIELWDLYDENRKLLNKTHVRGVPLSKGEYPIVVDKIDRKKLLIFFDGIRGLFLLFLLAATYMNGGFNLLMIYSIMFIYAIAETFYNPATNAMIPLLFYENTYTIANSLTSWVQNLSLLIGSILGTVIYLSFGIFNKFCQQAMTC
jgi:ribonuclease BN (tRNA processing enzyme)